MSDLLDRSSEPRAKEDPEALVLRGRPRPVVRFRRGLIVAVTGSIAAGLVTFSWLALDAPTVGTGRAADGADEPHPIAAPEPLADAPESYGQVPHLGPPLPGDLGRPILEREREVGEPMPLEPPGRAGEADPAVAAAESERRREADALDAARSSRLMVELGGGQGAAGAGEGAAAAGPVAAAAGPAAASMAASGGNIPADQQHRNKFAPGTGVDVDPHRLQQAPSQWTLSAGTIIPASLITGLNSDLPGAVLAQVTENIRDSATGRAVLIPQGARLLGSYDSAVAYGQRRALVVWKRILFPNGSSIGLDNVPAADGAGYVGLEDRVDSHGWQLVKGIALSTLLGVGTQLSLGGGSPLVRAIRESAEQNAADAGDRITGRNLDVQPTITVRPGWPVRAVLNEDLVLQPWRG